jgi:hypothetical protein
LPGDRVVGLKFSEAWAERVAVGGDYLAKVPDGVSLESAVILPVAGLTASLALSKKPLSWRDIDAITRAAVSALQGQGGSARGLIQKQDKTVEDVMSVEKRRITFRSETRTLVGHLRLPEGFSEQARYPSVVVVGPGSSVKEQAGAVYAEKLAAQGYVTLVFDPSYQGGERRLAA